MSEWPKAFIIAVALICVTYLISSSPLVFVHSTLAVVLSDLGRWSNMWGGVCYK